MDQRRELRGDCARCMGLCCISLAFDAGERFAFDKAADTACRHLSATNRCQIHASLAARGFAGCASYDCYGAGQRVSEELFPGRSWRTHPALAPAMFAAFRTLKRVHELCLLLVEAQKLELPSALAARAGELLARLEPAEGHTLDGLETMDLARCEREVFAYLRTLGEVARRAGKGR